MTSSLERPREKVASDSKAWGGPEAPGWALQNRSTQAIDLRGVPRKNRKRTTGALRDHCLEEDTLAGGQALTNFSLAQALLTQER